MRAWLFVLTCVLMVPLARAQETSEAVGLLDEGNRLFRDGEFEAALDAYERARDAGYVSGPLYYNMGNAYFRLDDIGQAIRHYEKARRWMPERPELTHNLTLSREQTVDRFTRMPEPFWRPAWDGLTRILTPAGLFLLGIFFYVVATAALVARVRRGPSPWRRRTALAAGLVAIAFIGLGIAASYERVHDVQAVVLHSQVALLDRPDGAATEAIVHEGTMVDVVTTRASWSEIRLPNGTHGWVRSTSFGTI